MRYRVMMILGAGLVLGVALAPGTGCGNSDDKSRADRGPDMPTADRGPDTVPWAPDATTWNYCSGWQVSCRKGNTECCPHRSAPRCPTGWSCLHLDCFSKTGSSCPVGKYCSPYRGCTCVKSNGTCPPCHDCRDDCQNHGKCGW